MGFHRPRGRRLELSVVNPVAVFGPVLGPDFSTSIILTQRLLDGALPGLPRLQFGVVDVRDVADLHVRAMTNPAAKGERFLAVAGDFMSVAEIARVLKSRLGAVASRVPTRSVPSWLVRLVAMADPSVRQIVSELDKVEECDQRQGPAPAGLGAALGRGGDRRQRREPRPAWTSKRQREARRVI